MEYDNQTFRPKSAPARHVQSRASSAGSVRDVVMSGGQTEKQALTLEETVNNFHTTDRILHRMKERRRTEAEIIVNEKPAGILAMEITSRKLSKIETENVIARVCQPTAAFSARISSNKRINAKDIYVPPKNKKAVRIQQFEFDCDRFKGNRPLSGHALHSLVHRLSRYDSERRPPDSRRAQTPDLRKQLGPLASYRWKGVKNC